MAEITDRPDLFDETADPTIWSRMSVGDRRLTWQEAYEHEREAAQRGERWRQLVSDFDRCEHGRHEGDVCSGCGGPSYGNPILNALFDGGSVYCGPPERPVVERQIGYTLDAGPIVMPADLRNRVSVSNWMPS